MLSHTLPSSLPLPASLACLYCFLCSPVLPAFVLLYCPQEIDELYKIFMKLGTPDENVWPGVRNLPDWKETFPKWRAAPLRDICPNLDPLGLDLLGRMLVYDPQLRITARAALTHDYFRDVQDLVAHNLHAGGLQFG